MNFKEIITIHHSIHNNLCNFCSKSFLLLLYTLLSSVANNYSRKKFIDFFYHETDFCSKTNKIENIKNSKNFETVKHTHFSLRTFIFWSTIHVWFLCLVIYLLSGPSFWHNKMFHQQTFSQPVSQSVIIIVQKKVYSLRHLMTWDIFPLPFQ